MFFISEKKFNETITKEVERQVFNYTHSKEAVNNIDDMVKASIAINEAKKTDDKLKEIFDAWIKEALDDITVKEYHWAFDHIGSRKESGKVEKSLSSIMTKICDTTFESLWKLTQFSNTEEFIDKVVERIQKKQITK